MRGQVIHRGSAWQVKVPSRRDPATGTRKYHTRTIHGTKKDAERYRTGVLREIDLGIFSEPSRKSFGDFIDDDWLPAVASRISERTKYEYECLLRRYVRKHLDHLRLVDIAPLHVQKVYPRMLDRGLSARTVRYTHSVISAAFKQAVKWRMMPMNPALAVDLPRVKREEMRALSPDEARRFLAAAKGNRLEAFFHGQITGGFRPGEAYALKWQDIDFSTGAVVVQRALTRVNPAAGPER